MKKVLITDGRSIAALAAVRSLGAKNFYVTCGDSFRNNYSFYSKYVRKKIVYRDPETDPDGFIEDIEREIHDGSYDLLVPIRDASVLVLSQYRERIEKKSKVFLASDDALRAGRDKARTMEIAEICNVPIPETYTYIRREVFLAEAYRWTHADSWEARP